MLEDSPFAGEGYRKVRARPRREHGIQVSGKRVLRLLRREGLLAPQRARGRRKPRPLDGTIIPAAPNVRWGTDATMAWTRSDGWVWVFALAWLVGSRRLQVRDERRADILLGFSSPWPAPWSA